MNISTKIIILAGSLITLGFPVFAAEETGGKYENLLVQVLMANGDGECPSSLMVESLKASCESQLPDIKVKLSTLGKITKVVYQGTRKMNGGLGERYKVVFQHGDWDWSLNTQSDGRVLMAFAPAPHYEVGSYSLNEQ